MRKLPRILATLALVLGAGTAMAQTVTLRYSNWLPPTHFLMTDVFDPYFKEIEKVTDGRVKVEILPKTVGTPVSQFDVVRDGLADMSYIIPQYTPNRFKLAEMADLPFNGESKTMMAAFHRVYSKHFSKYNEFKGVEVMAIWSASPPHLATRSRQVKTLEDFKGLKMRVGGDVAARLLSALGGVPILKSSAEAFEMLSTGVIDGSTMIAETIVNSKVVDLLRYYTIVPGGFVSGSNAIVIQADKWSQISPRDQQAIQAISGEKLAQAYNDSYTKQNAQAMEIFRKAHYTIIELEPAVVAQLKEKVRFAESDWIKAAKAKGVLDPAAALAEYRAEIAKQLK